MARKPKKYSEPKVFLGWPVEMWWEIRNWLADRGAPKESPLAILSRLDK